MSSQVLQNVIVAVDHAAAKAFFTQHARAGASAHEIAPDAPRHFKNHTDRPGHDAGRDKVYPQDLAYFEQIAEACKPAGRIVLIGRGKGQSNEAHTLAAYLTSHHPDIASRVLPLLTADLSHVTDAQLIELGHQALQVSARS